MRRLREDGECSLSHSGEHLVAYPLACPKENGEETFFPPESYKIKSGPITTHEKIQQRGSEIDGGMGRRLRRTGAPVV